MSADQEIERIDARLRQVEEDEDKRNVARKRHLAERKKEDIAKQAQREDEDFLIKTAVEDLSRMRKKYDIRRHNTRNDEDTTYHNGVKVHDEEEMVSHSVFLRTSLSH
jgi:hypothetical protein